MEQTRDRQTGEILDAVELDRRIRRDPSIRGTYRGWLECPECVGVAAFRKRSSDGRAAHFMADHDPDCKLRGREVDSTPGTLDEERPARVNDAEDLTLRLDPPVITGTPEGRVTNTPDADEDAPRGASSRRGAPEGENARSIGLRRLLANLRANPGFIADRPAGGVIHDERVIPAVHWDSVTREGNDWHNQTILLWGRIHSARNFKDVKIYLNQGPYRANRASIELDHEHLTALITRYRNLDIDNIVDFRGWHVIAYGRCTSIPGYELNLRATPDAIAFLPPA